MLRITGSQRLDSGLRRNDGFLKEERLKGKGKKEVSGFKCQVSSFKIRSKAWGKKFQDPSCRFQVPGEIQKLKSWIPAFAGMTGLVDSGMRRNDGRMWIPAFAGMTGWRKRKTSRTLTP